MIAITASQRLSLVNAVAVQTALQPRLCNWLSEKFRFTNSSQAFCYFEGLDLGQNGRR